MLNALKTGAAALALVVTAAPVLAADLGGYRGGSIKDGYAPVAPVYSAAGPCYVRSDVGYSWSSTPNATFVGNVDPSVTSESLSDGALFEAGIGCSMGSRGIRGEFVLGTREEKSFKGHYVDFTAVPVDPILSTHIKSYTAMFNVYHDLGRFGNVVPYIGFGAGWAWHKMGDVHSDFVPPGGAGCGGCALFGEDKVSFAWALMAGLGYQISDRAILDVGYRYIDMGKARSSHHDSTNNWNPRLEVDDIRAHELKIGLRYHFGTAEAAPVYAPMK